MYQFGSYEIDGIGPSTPVIAVGDVLYGTTAAGGIYTCGTVFRFDTKTHKENTVYSFTCGADGGSPSALLHHKDKLYGTSQGVYGTPLPYGAVFALTP